MAFSIRYRVNDRLHQVTLCAFTYEPPNELISVFPLVLVPVYLVPLAILLHLASLVK